VKDLYDRAYTTNFDSLPPSSKTNQFAMQQSIAFDSTQDTNVIIFVHGLNTSEFAYYNDAETMFKRLYWQGYEGVFGAFRWPSPVFTGIQSDSNQISYLGFNTGEYNSWHAGVALKSYLDSLTNRFPAYKINLAVHSLGNVAANEAIREGAHVDNYALMQAAISAGAFDGNNTNLIYSYVAATAGNSPDANALGGYKNCFTNATRRVNFYNDDDYALFQGFLHAWEGNQLRYRPDVFTYPGGDTYTYSYDGTNCFFDLTVGVTSLAHRSILEDFEKKAYVARSRTKAVGAAGLKYDPFALTQGSISNNISLQDTSLGFVGGAAFGTTRPDHSGEFTKDIQDASPFYSALLQDGFLIISNP
jgi:pimeloyl-ACP methyl ester carboxylesterase